ncbi:unnamed protein product [Didymodactylos carnosus]|uniref:Nucleotide-diphospho-sugar transferase domain-containing protein n=1 Tax=Didymodactylos carnosus TaxID=1234261 RepID=A0A814PNR7_9BILA|nr:unnamed protein product [Didymodactylos carnosus]CAF3873096.1 unnamed protein product [Didymodactylos carnosus]
MHIFPPNLHPKNAGPSDRNANVVNWGLATVAKDFLANGTTVLLLDGDVLPLSPFDSQTLLNSRDMVCRKHPAPLSRYCWIGFICLAPQLFSTLDDFNVSPIMRSNRAYDSGGRTIEYLLKYRNVSFSWMKETILLHTDEGLFWGAVDVDIKWVEHHFDRCDKCGPEVFLSADNDAVFYHMISGTSNWRFPDQQQRSQSLHDSLMRSPYGPTRQFSMLELIASVRKVQKMDMIPFHGNLTCSTICRG